MAKKSKKTKGKKPVPDDGALRLPGPNDPLTTKEQDRLFEILDRTLSKTLLPGELQNVQRMRATLLWYRSILPEEGIDEMLPARVRRNRLGYLHVPACRACGCTDLHACEGGCHWVEQDLCSRCAERDETEPRRETK